MRDIVTRLRGFWGDVTNRDILEAADEIEHLQAERKRLRRIIFNLLDDGDETDRAEARAALEGQEEKP